MWLRFSEKVADGSEGKFAVTESKFLPRCQNPQFCGFAPRGKLVGVATPNPPFAACAAEKICPDTCVLDKNCPLQFERS